MSLEALRESLPDYAKDLKLNLSSLITDAALNDQQRFGCFVACAIAGRNARLTKAVIDEFSGKLSPEALNAAKSAAAIMGMNNIYYRFTHLTGNQEYRQMPAKLRMNVIGNPGVDKIDFELWSMAVSAVNGCGMCMDNHEEKLKKAGISAEAIQAAVRIGAVLHGVATVLDAEEAL
ncbi:MAG: carboxymuconolactone decarboxylase family protein [Proteobacteria bacterium]|nr:carboxymuconolactone decarboxylase family protein [Pseudomonadota bacterium]